MSSIYFTEIVILAMIIGAAYKYRKFSHPATYVAIAVNLFNLLLEPLGRNKTVQSFLEAVLKG
jgi:uncharacterized membrane protein